jgi:hypothetical protein
MTDEDRVFLTPVSPGLVDYCWVEAGTLLKKACDVSNGRYDIISLRREIDSGSQHLWILYRGDNEMIAAFTTSISTYPLKSYINISFCGSNDEGIWIKHRDVIISSVTGWGKNFGCSGFEIIGRMGWVKSLAPLGFKRSHVTIEKEI